MKAGSPTRNRRDDQPVGGPSGASGTNLRNETTRPANPDSDDENVSLGAPIVSIPASSQTQGRRMRWTREFNLDLMRAYYKVTDMGNNKTGYRLLLEIEWKVMHPLLELSAQRLSDQVRSIINRKALSEAELDNLKKEIRTELQGTPSILLTTGDPTEHLQPVQNEEHPATAEQTLSPIRTELQGVSPAVLTPMHPLVNHQLTPHNDQSEAAEQNLSVDIEEMLTAIELKFEGVPIESRPRLRKLHPDKRITPIVKSTDQHLKRRLEHISSLEDICHLVYCAANVVIDKSDRSTNQKKQSTISGEVSVVEAPETSRVQTSSPSTSVPPWQLRLEKKICFIRKDVGVLHTYLNNEKPSVRVKKKAKEIARHVKIKPSDPAFRQKLSVHLDILKQKIAALGNRVRRYRIRSSRYQQNLQFNRDTKKFYRNLHQNQSTDTRVPDQESMKTFWQGIWSKPIRHDPEAYWIPKLRNETKNIRQMEHPQVTAADINTVVLRLKNWSAPGVDGIHNYWWKAFKSTHLVLAKQFQRACEKPDIIPPYFTLGLTHMLPKTGDPEDPKNYRPITCLSTVYKILTSVVNNKIKHHLKTENILAWEQNGCKQGARGCKELLVIDSVLTKQAKRKKRNLSVAWIDYRKAFDSVPHSWLLEILKIYKIHPKVTMLLQHLMASWRTVLNVKEYKTQEINIRRGIFQGDSLSPLWFCMSLNPLSGMLNRSGNGYLLDERTKISHLFYMDDLKVYAKNGQQLLGSLEVVKSFSSAIGMELGIDKCAVLHAESGKIIPGGNALLMDGVTNIPSLRPEEAYKYLGFQQGLGVDEKRSKEKIKSEFFRRIEIILRTLLYSKNKMSALNSWAIPVIAYSFGVVSWSRTELGSLDRKLRTMLTRHRMLHPNSAIERLYLSRSEGGRGMLNLEEQHSREKENLVKYFCKSNLPIHKTLLRIDKKLSVLNLSSPVTPLSNFKELLKRQWSGKAMHGRFFHSIDNQNVDSQASNTYLREGYLFAETEGALLAIQDQVVPTRYYRKHIMKQQVETTKCRLCGKEEESVQHIISACSVLAPIAYQSRHDDMGKVLHLMVAQKTGLIKDNIVMYKYKPSPILENVQVKLYWDTTVVTDKEVLHNRPDMIIVDKEKKLCIIIDFSVPLDDNVDKVYREKINKYQLLADEIRSFWNVQKVEIKPFIVTANGLVHKMLPVHLKQLDISSNAIKWMQKAVVLGTTSIIRRTLSK